MFKAHIGCNSLFAAGYGWWWWAYIHMGDCTTLGAIFMLMTLYHYYIGLLYWLSQEIFEEMGREQWNNAARHRGQRAHTRRQWKYGASAFGNGEWWEQTLGAVEAVNLGIGMCDIMCGGHVRRQNPSHTHVIKFCPNVTKFARVLSRTRCPISILEFQFLSEYEWSGDFSKGSVHILSFGTLLSTTLAISKTSGRSLDVSGFFVKT